MNGIGKQTLPWWKKYTLSLEEAAEYFGISYKKPRIFCKKHEDESGSSRDQEKRKDAFLQ